MRQLTFLAIISVALCRAQAPAVLEGHITSVTGEALKKVSVRLQQTVAAPGAPGGGAGAPIQMPAAFGTQSDAQGNFVFENLDPGRYTLSAERPGYIRQNYSASGGSNLLTLSAGQRMTGIDFKMTPESAIAGRVFDADGDPLPRARLTVLRAQYTNRGKQLLPVGSTQALVDGTFRVESLSAGRYYVSAQDQQSINVNTTAPPGKAAESSITTYYPSAIQVLASTPVNLTAGLEARGIDIRLVKARIFHVRGKVVDPTGATPPNASVRLVPNDGSDFFAVTPNGTVRNGTFDFPGLPAGEYLLMANPVTTRSADSTPTTLAMVGRQIVSVGSSDVNDVVFRIGPGADIAGKLSTEGGGTPPPKQPGQPPAPGANQKPRIILNPTEGPNQGSTTAQAQDDGTFAVHGVAPGIYQVTVVPIPAGSYLKSVRFGNEDIMKTGLDLTSGAGAVLDVVLSPNAADVSGTLHGSDGAPLAGVTVALWVADAAQAVFLDQPKLSITDTSGGFKFMGLAPGDYRVAAFERFDASIGIAAEFLSKFESKAAKVKLSENSHETADAPLVGRDAFEAAAAELR
jgi:hypothetical protein